MVVYFHPHSRIEMDWCFIMIIEMSFIQGDQMIIFFLTYSMVRLRQEMYEQTRTYDY